MKKGEIVDVIRGINPNHLYFKERIVWLSELEILADEKSSIQRGDEIYKGEKIFFVKDFKLQSDGFRKFMLSQK